MIAKMTPIEWFANEINGMDTAVSINAFKELFEKAKQLEKLQNHSEYMSGWYNGFNSQEIETKGLEKTAVDWLVEQFINNKFVKAYEQIEAIDQAKEMENSQRQKDFKAGNECACMCHENIEDYFNQYIKSE